jgi:hypothetical protein
VIAMLHNGLLVLFLALEAGTRNAYLLGALWIGSALYTAALGTVASLLNTR